MPSSEEESDGGFSSGDEERKHHENESKKEKLGRQQREKRRLKARRARKSDLRAAKTVAGADDAEDGDQEGKVTQEDDQSDAGSEDEEARAREAKLKAKFERFKEHAEKCAHLRASSNLPPSFKQLARQLTPRALQVCLHSR